jgi:NAD(P)-dependent dehydrogenase (short-subunit alcohol dehydrogenase family)
LSTLDAGRPGVAFVTGAASDIGRAVAARLAGDGFALALLDLDGESLRDARESLESHGHSLRACACDVCDEQAVGHAIAEVLSGEERRVSVLVNCAAVVIRRALLESTLAEWRRTFDVNLFGAYVMTKAIAPLLVKQGGGAIVNVGSTTGPLAPEPGSAAYAASKAGLLALTDSTAIELGPAGIRCNTVSPGFIRTRATEAAYGVESVRLAREAAVPLGRVGRPDDVARAVSFLVSEEAAFITGQNLVVDGGLLRNLFAQVPGRQALRETEA